MESSSSKSSKASKRSLAIFFASSAEISLENFSFTLQIHQKSSENLFKSLVIHLQRNILSSFGYFNNIFSVSLNKNFYHNFYIKNTDFENVAKTGDLLLFKGFDKKSKSII